MAIKGIQTAFSKMYTQLNIQSKLQSYLDNGTGIYFSRFVFLSPSHLLCILKLVLSIQIKSNQLESQWQMWIHNRWL